MSWPLVSDFARLLKTPKVAFRDPGLRECTIEMNHLGQPRPRSGNFATVYRAYRPDGSEVAVRVFNRRSEARRERYRQVSQYLEGRKVHSLVRFEYDEKGIRAASDGKLYPLLTMEWVPGVTLFEWARDRSREGYQEALTIGADVWLQVVRELSTHEIVHGDLQHGNVMVSSEGYFKLVDYDCLAVPSLLGQPNLEIGLEPYQHPRRTADTQLYPGLDNFSALVIYVALRALAAAPHLWITHVDNTGYDKLLFRKEDLLSPASSRLYHDLMNSPDDQVRDLTHYLVQLVHYNLQDIPPIDEVLLWCNSLEDLLAARDWDMAAQLVSRMGEGEQIAPHLQQQVALAQQRVACREALEKAIAAGDEQEIQRCYVPHLLDDYPAAAQLVEQARTAAETIRVLELLKAAKQFQNWDVYRKTWRENSQMLDGRKSAEPYRREMRRLIAADTVGKLLKDKTGDDKTIIDAWNYLQSHGGHVTSEPLKPQVQWRARRYQRFQKLREILENYPATPDLAHDRALVSTYKAEYFDGDARYQSLRERHEAALARLKTLRTFLELADQCSVESEQKISGVLTELPETYHPKLKRRCRQAILRMRNLQNLQQALAAPASDSAILAAVEAMESVSGESLIGDAEKERIALAEQRRPVLEQLESLAQNWPPDELDRRILDIWDEKLLADCHDASRWLPTYQRARQRQIVIENLTKAIETADVTTIDQLLSDPSLHGYPLTADVTEGMEQARQLHHKKQLARRQAMVDALLESNRSDFVEFFDVATLREICQQYQHHQAVVARLTESEILPLTRSNLAKGEGGGLEKTSDTEYIARWNWPPAKFAKDCRLVVCQHLPPSHSDPESTPAVYSVSITRAQWEVDGNCHKIQIVPEWIDCHVLVWFTIDLGFQTFTSQPLSLGQLKPAKAKRRWGLFG